MEQEENVNAHGSDENLPCVMYFTIKNKHEKHNTRETPAPALVKFLFLTFSFSFRNKTVVKKNRPAVCQSKQLPRSGGNQTARRRNAASLSAVSLCVRCTSTFMSDKIIHDRVRRKKYNNLEEISALQLGNLRAVSQREWQPPVPTETAVNWVS